MESSHISCFVNFFARVEEESLVGAAVASRTGSTLSTGAAGTGDIIMVADDGADGLAAASAGFDRLNICRIYYLLPQ